MNQPPYRNQPGVQSRPQSARPYGQPVTTPTPVARDEAPATRSRHTSFLYSKSLLLSLTLLVLILGAFLVFQLTRPANLPASWLSTETVGKEHIVYYLHWNDDNGALRGNLESALYAGESLHASSWAFVATYDAQNNRLHMVFDKANAANIPFYTADAIIDGDTLAIKQANNSDMTNNALVFHTASVQDYNQAKNDLTKNA